MKLSINLGLLGHPIRNNKIEALNEPSSPLPLSINQEHIMMFQLREPHLILNYNHTLLV